MVMSTTPAHTPTEPAAKFRGRAVVAGAGPVGAMVAITLAQQGWEVQVHMFARPNLEADLMIMCTA